jgi:acyl-CoA thioester hydrolase
MTPAGRAERLPRPTRDDYVVWRRATTRWADDDVYGHMNNATYYELAETSCRYFAEIGFPEPVDVGLAVERVGTSSVVYRIGLFQGEDDQAAAEGRFVHVYVENVPDPERGNRSRPVRPLPEEIRPVVTSLTAPR